LKTKEKNPLNLDVLDLKKEKKKRKRHEISKEKKVILITLLPSVIFTVTKHAHMHSKDDEEEIVLCIDMHCV